MHSIYFGSTHESILCRFVHSHNLYIQWLPEQMECGNPQIRKSAVALWITVTQKMIDTSFESPKCKLYFEISNTSKTVRLLDF